MCANLLRSVDQSADANPVPDAYAGLDADAALVVADIDTAADLVPYS